MEVTATGTSTGSIPVGTGILTLPLDVAHDAGGRGVILWVGNGTPGSLARPGLMSTHLLGNGRTAATSVLAPSVNTSTPGDVRLEPLADGSLLGAYTSGSQVIAVHRAMDSDAFGALQAVGQAAGATNVASLTISPGPERAGEAVVSWGGGAGTNVAPILPSTANPGFGGSVLDRTGPAFTASIPATAERGDPVNFSASTPQDAWSAVVGTISWSFGDGGGPAAGATRTHAFAAPGSYRATASATDSAGNTATQSGTVDVRQTRDSRTTAGSGSGSGNLERVEGTVLIKRPGSLRYLRVDGSTMIAVGTLVDATQGTVHLTTARDLEGHTQTGEFSGGIFEYTQHLASNGAPVDVGPMATASAADRELITDITLAGTTFAGCPVSGAGDGSAQSSRRRVVRYLRAKARGNFNVVGRSAQGIERGTAWTTTDTCDATEISVSDGAVDVIDLVRLKTVTVTAGHTYVAPHAPGIAGVDSHTADRQSLVDNGLRFRQTFPGAGVAEWYIDLSVWDKPTVKVADTSRPIPPPMTIGSARRKVGLPGSQEVTVRLSDAGKRLLSRHPRARLVLRWRFVPRAVAARGTARKRRLDVLAPLPL